MDWEIGDFVRFRPLFWGRGKGKAKAGEEERIIKKRKNGREENVQRPQSSSSSSSSSRDSSMALLGQYGETNTLAPS